MEQKYYTVERNVQIMISLLKAHGIKRVIASPGTTNMTFVGSIQQDPWFEIYSSVDERSAAYLACGMAEETGEPVVLSCTGATASRNYLPGLTEAFYRKLPVIALTSHRGDYRIGHVLDQQIDRRQSQNDIAVEKVTIPLVKDAEDEQYCILQANKAILALKHRGGGPVHINMFTKYRLDFSAKELPPVRAIYRFTSFDTLPELKENLKVAIFVGSHSPFTEEQTKAIDHFCSTRNSVVFCDHTSGYYGKYRVFFAIPCSQRNYDSPLRHVDVLIHIGEVSGNAYGMAITSNVVWRVNEDGELRDTFGRLNKVFEMPEQYFFSKYALSVEKDDSYLLACKEEYNRLLNRIPELPFSNLWMAKIMHDKLPSNCVLHLGILNSLRSWNFFETDATIRSNSNVGGFGIDGGLSSLLGASMMHPEKLFFGIFGDLAFFYDMNVLGNRHVGNNVRILLINNGKGNEFRNYGHICHQFGEDADKYMAAAGHYGNKSPDLIRHYATDLGYRYLTASNKEEFLANLDDFLDPQITEGAIIFEVFTNTPDESNSIETMLNFEVDQTVVLRRKITKAVEGTPIESVVNTVRKILR